MEESSKMPNFCFCCVPQCKNTSVGNSKPKIFFTLPKDKIRRQQWLKLCRKTESLFSTPLVCEDHFDLKSDLVNYLDYKNKNKNACPKLKPTAVPTKFECQESMQSCGRGETSVLVNRKQLWNKLLEGDSSAQEKLTLSEDLIKFRSHFERYDIKTANLFDSDMQCLNRIYFVQEYIINVPILITSLNEIIVSKSHIISNWYNYDPIVFIACINAIGQKIPPYVWKAHGKTFKRPDGKLTSEQLEMWLGHFIQHKVKGKVLLVFNNNASDLLQNLKENEIKMFKNAEIAVHVLPHITNFDINPLGRGIFEKFQLYFHQFIVEKIKKTPKSFIATCPSLIKISNLCWGLISVHYILQELKKCGYSELVNPNAANKEAAITVFDAHDPETVTTVECMQDTPQEADASYSSSQTNDRNSNRMEFESVYLPTPMLHNTQHDSNISVPDCDDVLNVSLEATDLNCEELEIKDILPPINSTEESKLSVTIISNTTSKLVRKDNGAAICNKLMAEADTGVVNPISHQSPALNTNIRNVQPNKPEITSISNNFKTNLLKCQNTHDTQNTASIISNTTSKFVEQDNTAILCNKIVAQGNPGMSTTPVADSLNKSSELQGKIARTSYDGLNPNETFLWFSTDAPQVGLSDVITTSEPILVKFKKLKLNQTASFKWPKLSKAIKKYLKLTCIICKKKCSCPESFKQHLNDLHPQERYICTFCSGVFDIKSILQHILLNHKCRVCGAEAASRSALMEHIKYRHESDQHEPFVLNDRYNFSAVKISLKSKHKWFRSTLQCDGCGWQDKTVKRCQSHLNQGCLLFTCNDCHREFYTLATLKGHLLQDHLKRYECSFKGCKKVYMYQQSLKLHYHLYHSMPLEFRNEKKVKSKKNKKDGMENEQAMQTTDSGRPLRRSAVKYLARIRSQNISRMSLTCNECGCKKLSRKAMRIHLWFKHLSHKNLVCVTCQFKSVTLKQHWRHIKKLKCSYHAYEIFN